MREGYGGRLLISRSVGGNCEFGSEVSKDIDCSVLNPLTPRSNL